jgi:cytochrome P450
MSEEEIRQAGQAAMQMIEYLGDLIAERRVRPTDDLLSGLVAGAEPAERMDERDRMSTMALLLVGYLRWDRHRACLVGFWPLSSRVTPR